MECPVVLPCYTRRFKIHDTDIINSIQHNFYQYNKIIIRAAYDQISNVEINRYLKSYLEY